MYSESESRRFWQVWRRSTFAVEVDDQDRVTITQAIRRKGNNPDKKEIFDTSHHAKDHLIKHRTQANLAGITELVVAATGVGVIALGAAKIKSDGAEAVEIGVGGLSAFLLGLTTATKNFFVEVPHERRKINLLNKIVKNKASRQG